MGKADHLKIGEWNGICDRCGEKRKSSDLKKTWDNLYVCADTCWEPRHPMDFLRGKQDDPSTPWSRPEEGDAGGTDIEGNTFPPTYTFTPDPPPDGDNNGDL